MKKSKRNNYIHFLRPDIWNINEQNIRSEELTPLYINRYDGLRTNPIMSSHDYWEMTFVFHGRGILKAGKNFQLEPNTICLIPPNIRHLEVSKDKMDTLWMGVCGSNLNFLDNKQIYSAINPELNFLFEKLWLETERSYDTTGIKLDGFIKVIFGSFIKSTNDAKQNSLDCIDDAIQYLQKKLSDNFTISFLANKFGYSEGYFYRAFKKRTGQTPINFLMRLRIQQANRMLQHTSLSVKKIAKIVGFNDPFYFSKVYHKYTGHTPSQSRILLK